METKKLTIISDGSPVGSRVMVGDIEITGVRSIKVVVDAYNPAVATIEVYPELINMAVDIDSSKVLAVPVK